MLSSGVGRAGPILFSYRKIIVPNGKSRNIPEVVIVRRGAGGVLGIGKGGSIGWRVEQTGSVYKLPRGRCTIPITTGGCQVSRREHKGNTKGCKGKPARGGKSKWECAMYICNCIVCATEWLDAELMTLFIVYIIIIRMNVVDNLNSV